MKMQAVIFSIALHLTFAGALLFNTLPELKPTSVTLEFEVKTPAQDVGVKRGSRSQGNAAALRKKRLDAVFFPKTSAAGVLAMLEENPSAGDVYGRAIYNARDGDNTNWSHHWAVYEKINSSLMFDSILAQYNHFGDVDVEFGVDSSGVFQTDGLRVRARDRILQVHVLRTLQRSLSEPMVDFQQSKLNQATVFTAKFSFLVGSPRRNFKKETRNAKPAFVFERYTNESPVPTDLGSHLLSGGVTLNVPAMINRWDKYNQAKYRDATKFDPFEGHKRDRFYNL